jgi:hypothetical protein
LLRSAAKKWNITTGRLFRDTSRAVITLAHALFGLALTLTTWRALSQDW